MGNDVFRTTRRGALKWGALGCASAAVPAWANTTPYPTRPVSIVVASAPGSQFDAMARKIAQKLEVHFKRPFVVDNRPGAGGNIGSAHVANAPADGYTLQIAALSHAVFNPIVYKDMPYKEDAFTFVSIACEAPAILSVRSDSPFKTFQEFAEALKKNPNQYSYGSAGLGTLSHVSGEMLLKMIGAQGVVHVPYKGLAAILPDLLAGRITYSFDTPLSLKKYLEGGVLRGLLVASDYQIPGTPRMPTPQEVGLPDFRGGTWYGWRIRSETPRPIIDALAAAFIAINNDPEMLEFYAAGGAVPHRNSTPERANQFVEAERVAWDPYVRASGASAPR